MFGSAQFGRSQFGQPPEAGVTVTVEPLDALADIGPVNVRTAGGGGRPPHWFPLIPADWPVPKKKPKSVSVHARVTVLALDAAASVTDCSVSAGASASARILLASVHLGACSVSCGSVAHPRPVLCEASLGLVRARAIRNPTDAELTVILLHA